jgi:hypothetical protein
VACSPKPKGGIPPKTKKSQAYKAEVKIANTPTNMSE